MHRCVSRHYDVVEILALKNHVLRQAVVELTAQYRMAEDIMSLANALVYGGRLSCANEAVAAATLAQSHPSQVPGLPPWLQQVREGETHLPPSQIISPYASDQIQASLDSLWFNSFSNDMRSPCMSRIVICEAGFQKDKGLWISHHALEEKEAFKTCSFMVWPSKL